MERKVLPVHGACLVILSLFLGMANITLAAPGVEIYNQEAAQFEFVSESSPVIHIDVVDPSILQNRFTKQAILAVTHGHPDHYDKTLIDSFPGKSLVKKAGHISFNTGKIISIPSTHSEKIEGAFLVENGSNYIMLVELNGLKIAHLGDIGQASLTKNQLGMLADVDIVITQFMNPLSDMDMENKKAFNLVAQLSPKIVIPTTHGRLNEGVIRHAKKLWEVYASEEPSLTFDKATLPQKTTMLVWGDGVFFVTEDHALPEWNVTK
ncbi:MBL fold metallo-hydrolase [Desulforhopalus sp. 52FAK]